MTNVSKERTLQRMKVKTNICLFVFFLFFLLDYAHAKKINITVGYLTVDQTDKFVRDRQGRIISGAISVALNQVNGDPDILPDYYLDFVWGDTRANTLVGTKLLTQQWRKGAVAFFGLEDSCKVEARVAAAWNLPMVSYKCADYEVSDKEKYPTFARTFPPVTQVTKSIISLLLHFQWKRFTLIVGSSHKQQTIAEKLLELVKQYNMTLNTRLDYNEPHVPLASGNPFPGIVENTYIDTRVYVFLGGLNGVVDLMTNLYDRGLLDTGEYIVIFVDHTTFDPDDVLRYFKRTVDKPDERRNIEAAQSLLVITYSPPTSNNYSQFHKDVNMYNELPPFNFPNPFGQPKKITVYAAYLYDAVFLYAKAAHKVISRGGDILNGTAIIEQLLDTNYLSIQGVMTHINNNGDAEGNYTLLARVPHQLVDYSMQPVGHFELDDTFLPNLKMFRDQMISWISTTPPIDEPACGYRGEKCIPPKRYTLEIIGGIAGGFALIIIIIILIAYRNWRYEQEIAGLLWKIPKEEIHADLHGHKNKQFTLDADKKETYGSKYSLNSQQSIDSRISNQQVYATTSYYKGQMVASKKYEIKNLDITRKMQKEMKMMKDQRHGNVNAFIGACIDAPSFIILTDYCSKGSLQDILENDTLKLDGMFVASLIKDMIQGIIFIHNSELGYHGNLKSSNCVVNSRWTLQVADFGLLEIRSATYRKEDEHAYYRNLFWRAPEHLRQTHHLTGSPTGDSYSFGIILHEVIGRSGPFGFCNMEPKDIIERVKRGGDNPFRPYTGNLKCEQYVIDCLKACWMEDPSDRPDFREIYKQLHKMREGMKRDIFNNMVSMMESYQNHLEELVEERTVLLAEEKRKTETLLHRMLPRSIADQLKQGKFVEPESFDFVTIYFSDICDFTKLSAESTPMQVVDLLNDLYTCFDSIIKNYDVYKVETIGDAYMVVSGIPIRNGDFHAGEIASMSLELLNNIKTFRIPHRPNETLLLRIGIHSGPCVAGVVGLTMPRYTLFGDTVNTAARMESNGEPLRIHCSKQCKDLLDKLGGYTTEPRGVVPMKGKGNLFTYWLTAENSEIRRQRMRRCSQALKYNSPLTLEIRQPYLRHMVSDSDSPTLTTKHENSIDLDSSAGQPLMELLRDSDNRSIRSESPKLFSAFNDKRDSPKIVVSHAPVNLKMRHLPNGVLADEKRFNNLQLTGSGQDIMERTALISHHSFDVDDGYHGTDSGTGVRHFSVGNNNNMRICLPQSTYDRKSDRDISSKGTDQQCRDGFFSFSDSKV